MIFIGFIVIPEFDTPFFAHCKDLPLRDVVVEPFDGNRCHPTGC